MSSGAGRVYLKQRLAAGECLIGAGIYSNSPDLVEYAAVGMDWIWWECQHSQADWQTTLHGVRTAFGMGIPVLIRTWTHSGDTIERLLDTGAEGIIVPMINTADQARAVVSRCYYPPLGNRSFGSIRAERVEQDVSEWNRRVMAVMIIETPEAVENAEAIAQVEGVDALLVGAADLSLRLGKSYDAYTSHGNVEDALKHVVCVTQAAGKAAAVIAQTPEALNNRLREGYRLICAGMDVDHVEADFRRMREEFRKAVDEPRR